MLLRRLHVLSRLRVLSPRLRVPPPRLRVLSPRLRAPSPRLRAGLIIETRKENGKGKPREWKKVYAINVEKENQESEKGLCNKCVVSDHAEPRERLFIN